MHAQRRKNWGFTLVELVIVVIVIGILSIILLRNIGGGSTENARAMAVSSTARKLMDNWYVFTQVGSLSMDTSASSPAVGTGETALDILVGGYSYVEDTYKPAYMTSGIEPMHSIKKDGTDFKMNEFDIAMTYQSNPIENVCVVFTGTAGAFSRIISILREQHGGAALGAEQLTGYVQYPADASSVSFSYRGIACS